MLRRPKKYQVQGTNSVKRRWPIILAGLAVILGIIIALLLFNSKKAEAPDANQQLAGTEQADSPTKVTGKFMYSGTVVLARAVENAAKTATGYDYSQPFSQMSTFKPDQYDFWLVDWECPSSGDIIIPYATQIATLQFNCRPEWLPEFKKYFTAVNFANNHSADLGQEVFEETKNHHEKAGIQAVGNQDPGVLEDICEVMAMPVKLHMPDGNKKSANLPIAHCAWHYFERDPRSGEIETMQRYANKMPVFGLMHVGAEYVAIAGTQQQSVAKKIIDNGAEFVIGNSPHWVQNTEVYKDKLIVYSTGNFIFDQLETETNRGVNIAVSASVNYDENVAKWLALGDSCKVRYDSCIDEAERQNLSKINLNLSFEPVASTGGARQLTKKATPEIQKAVEQRMNWAQTLKQLGQN